jgi:hypothetical protein
MIQRGSCYLFYIAGKQGVKGIRLSMKDAGIDVAAFERAKRLKIVDSEEWYLISGKVPSFKPINEISLQFSRFQDEALSSSGVDCVLIISEIDMLTRKGFFPSYQEFDKILGRNIPKTIFVCTCDLQELKAAGISVDSLAVVHGTMAK